MSSNFCEYSTDEDVDIFGANESPHSKIQNDVIKIYVEERILCQNLFINKKFGFSE